MNTGAIILMIILFPLNSFLFLQKSFLGETRVHANAVKDEKSIQNLGEITEAKKNVQPETPKLKAQAVDDPEFQPVRKNAVKDLVVPNAHASVIIDADTGTILHYNEGREHRQIASLTKMMTAILVMEKIKNLDEVVTIDEESVYADGTKIGCPRSGYCMSTRLKIGEKISARSLLKAMLMNSANDAAIALGKHMGGTQENFAKMMNEKALELGLSDSHFCTASGLDLDDEAAAAGCYSSAYDIARIAAYSLRYKAIWDIARLPSNTIVTSADGKMEHTILNTDELLDQMPNMLGTKTGYTPMAGYSLLMVTADSSRKHRIVAVVLDDNQRWTDIKTMVDWTFSSYNWK